MNQISVTGNVGKDPELKYTAGGKAVVKFTIADTRGKDDQKETIWHNVVCFDEMAENVADQVKKGSRLLIQGRFSERKYQDKDGQDRTWQEIVADEIALSLRWGKKDATAALAKTFSAVEEDPF
jgi:single-strand DNA-binding protein